MVAEPVVGVVVRVAVELICGSVKVLAAALGVDQNHDPRAASILRVEVAGERLEFADGVNAQVRIFAVVCAYVGVDHAVEKEIVGRAAHSVDVEVVSLVEDQAELRIVVRDHAGQGRHQRFEVAAIQRLLSYLPLVDDGELFEVAVSIKGVWVVTVTVCEACPRVSATCPRPRLWS